VSANVGRSEAFTAASAECFNALATLVREILQPLAS
jgi:hypothetical protein